MNADIYKGHLSSSLCHLGLVAPWLNKNLDLNPDTERFVGDQAVNESIYLKRTFREPFVIPKKV